ncbi:MAG: hypothetical protein Q7T33_11600 [Dehalococcoidia bacterium]|nr:hypothetical protein [Dehalococcoidia bacterium]
MTTKELRFAMDEKGIKVLAPTLVGQIMSYWDSDRRLLRGRVTAAEVMRDRYGAPYIQVEIAEDTAPGAAEQPAAVAPAGEPLS